jgi:ABC-type bacteriocin/lantibiotic exporter with double-glycine peptidase domain
MPPALRIDSLWKCYAAGVRGCSVRLWVLRGLCLTVHAGERVAIVGAAGAGKSTLAACILGLRTADFGQVEVAGALEIIREQDVGRAIDSAARGTVLALARDAEPVRDWADRLLLLRDGELHTTTLHQARRVAERSIATSAVSAALR